MKERICCVCRQKFPMGELVRVAKTLTHPVTPPACHPSMLEGNTDSFFRKSAIQISEKTSEQFPSVRGVAAQRADGVCFFIDPRGNLNGRGCHVCYACIEKCIKTRALNRSFKCNVPNDVYEELAKSIANK